MTHVSAVQRIDGEQELDMKGFADKLGPLLSEDVTPTEMMQLFMKIDADCGGTIDWQGLSPCTRRLSTQC